MTHLEFECSDEKALFILKAARLYDEGLRDIPEWIPCSERLPEDGQTVIFTAKEVVDDDGSKFVEAGVYDAKKGWCYNDSYFPNAFTFVAWMPLPEPYKESEG